MRIVDSHVHFWHPQKLHYGWLEDIEMLNKPFLPEEYRVATAALQLEGIVFVQADCDAQQALDEVNWIDSLDAPIHAMVAFAPLENGDAVRANLEALAAHPRVKGVRRLIQSEAQGFALQANFVEAVQALADYKLSFDICVLSHQLSDVIALLKQCPNVQFVLDHAGKPNIKEGHLDTWRDHIRHLAEFENLHCKISGLVTEAHPLTWSTKDLSPYIEHLLETFGTKRLLFGSDFPVLNLAGGFARWFASLESILLPLSEAEKNAIYVNNARSFYRIAP